MKTLIGVCGSGGESQDISQQVCMIAEKIGFSIASNDAVLVSGGRDGVMEAACRGAKNANGITLGLLPYGKNDANSFVDIALATGLSFQRNFLIAQVVDGVIAIAGGWGTLSEVSSVMILKKPLVLVETGEGIVDKVIERKMIRDDDSVVASTRDPQEAVELLLSFIKKNQKPSKH